MADTAPATALQRWMEEQAGLVLNGPDAPFIEYTITTLTTHKLNYKALSIGGYDNEPQINAAMQMTVMSQVFDVLGNAVRLQRQPNQMGPMMLDATEGVPQGVILIWRPGGEPTYSIEDGIYSVSASFAVLPPFAQLVGAGAALRQF